jgi:hypothetical protein
MKTLAIALCVLLLSAPVFAQTFTLDAVSNCPGLGYGHNVLLLAQTYHIEWVSGSWSPVGDDSQLPGFAWEGQISYYDYATGLTNNLGATSPGYYATPAIAEAAAQGIYTIQGHGSVVTFFMQETGPTADVCADNRGSVTLRFVEPLATQPTTWGRIKSLYR